MRDLHIKKTPSTPAVDFNQQTNVLQIIGRSFPENARFFYTPILQWLLEIKPEFPDSFVLEINLEYYNTSSSKFLLELLHVLENYAKEHSKQISVRWYYACNDEDMKDAGEEYKQFINLPFEFVEFE